ncbi:LysR substrate-binding domain-containing protein [Aliiglaciecola sp. 3_MG-2023]|uniref:LysR substrate-binding domain-containing protein n=1 Tax=Aliiglaciecola sp. 3_MG-2023 TaxID=3062644 RepID=UPI0026E485E5|nr:LysR substrate-binding domain-containing protein [Aliiglaciecola sp. 3_MG-2023]MDO6693267.1 LysR substrate-binding domain-containing protein [Aliiglaciecola sp. 3_MG-2023]
MEQPLPPLKSLRFFMVAAELSSFKLAAEKLFVTQAAVSQQIKLLEDFLEQKLFERSNRQTQLTLSGELLLPYIQQGFTQFQSGLRAISGDANPNILRISTIHSFTSLWLMPRLPQFQKLHPELMIQLAPSNDLVDFNRGDIDLAIRMGAGGYKGLAEKKLVSDQLILVASPDIISRQQTNNPSMVFTLPWIEDTSADIVPVFENLCKTYAVNVQELTPSIRASNSVLLIENALAGRGFTLVNKSLVADHLHNGSLLTLLEFSSPSPYSLYLVAPEQNFEWQKVKLFESWFIPLLHQSFDDLKAW